MNRKIALALAFVSAAAAMPALADDPTIIDEHVASTASREAVIAEMQQFRQSGVNPWADEYNPLAQMHGDRSRAEVTAEFLHSREMVSALNGEDSGSAYLARRDGTQPPATQLAAMPVAEEE